MNFINHLIYPKFNIQSTNSLADVVNCFLQYIYSNDSEKKKTSLVKMKKVMSKINITEQYSFEELQNMLIRYLLRNIYFFENTKRVDESNLILNTRNIELPLSITLNKRLGDQLLTVMSSREYNNILSNIANSLDRKSEISSILNDYKTKVKK